MKSLTTGYWLVRRFLFLVLLLAGCASTINAAAPGTPDVGDPPAAPDTTLLDTALPDNLPDVAIEATGDPITVPLSLYVVLDESDPTESVLSSQRTEAGLQTIADNMGTIWAQANIVFDPVNVETIQVPRDTLGAIAIGLETDAFFDQAGVAFDIPNPGVVNGFYVREAASVNGFAPNGSRVFFVVDQPSVNNERVSSHEVGHIFALHHQLDDPGTLMFSGTNGTTLTEAEQSVARYAAQGVLDGVR